MWQRQSNRGPVPRIPPLLHWVQQLVAQGLPPAALPVALDYLSAMEASLTDASLAPRFQQYSRSMLRGSVGPAKAGGFLQLVLGELTPSQRAGESDCAPPETEHEMLPGGRPR